MKLITDENAQEFNQTRHVFIQFESGSSLEFEADGIDFIDGQSLIFVFLLKGEIITTVPGFAVTFVEFRNTGEASNVVFEEASR